jgi:novel protein kinase C epsilon type
MHENGVIHRDLKSENILIGKEGHVRLTDFGVSKGGLDPKKEGRSRTLMKGTLEFLDPHIVTAEEYGFSADYYCLGLVIYEMLSGGE